MIEGGNTYYYHSDGLGSITEITDELGNLLERYEYDVFGRVSIKDASGYTLQVSSIGNPYYFTGRRYDTETGLYFFRTRYYNADIGRFIQPDTIGYKADVNLYTYCHNNPINYIDPYGTCDWEWWRKMIEDVMRRLREQMERWWEEVEDWWNNLQEGWESPPFWPDKFPFAPSWRFNVEYNFEGGVDIEIQKGIEIGIGEYNINIPYTPHVPLIHTEDKWPYTA